MWDLLSGNAEATHDYFELKRLNAVRNRLLQKAESRVANVSLQPRVTRITRMKAAPEILAFHISRGRMHNKVGTSVEVPTALNAADFFRLPAGPAGGADQNEARPKFGRAVEGSAGREALDYELRAVVEHQGGQNNGHYVAYVQQDESRDWYCCSDLNTRRVAEAEVLRCEAYLLFYQRVAVN